MDFKDIVEQRYATKQFDGRKIPEEIIKVLFEFIRLAPSSWNLQPWTIIVVKDQQLKEQLAPAAHHQAQITSCSHLLIFCADMDIAQRIEDLKDIVMQAGISAVQAEQSAAAMRIFEQKLSPEKKLAWSQRQVYLALGNALNGAKALGFDSCPMEGFSPEEFAKMLALPSNLIPTVLCPLGYAADTPRKKLRFEKDDIFFAKP
ncbi:MAG: NAD(P)H-dependent oxidoreductase [Nanoarchaeota archaeon]